MTKSTNSFLNMEVKAIGDTEGGFTGTLSTYSNIDEVGDICVEGCFEQSLKNRGQKRTLLWQHNDFEPIGNFNVVDSKNDLKIEGSFNMDTRRGREGYSLLKRGDINGLSIGYLVNDYSYNSDGIRLLKAVDLLEGSLVTFPANTRATAQAKALSKRKTGIVKKLLAVKGIKQMDEAERNGIVEELYNLVVSLIDDGSETNPDEEGSKEDTELDPEENPDDESKLCGTDEDLEKIKSAILEKTKELKQMRGII
ncbi:MAG: HK97 family phage prohead protease [Candidatus Methanomethylophilaceae archaeon]